MKLGNAMISMTIKTNFVNRIREMGSFELAKEIEKEIFSSCQERGTKKKFRNPPQLLSPLLSYFINWKSRQFLVFYDRLSRKVVSGIPRSLE